MKTPFCVAIGIRQRELDELRRAIAAQLECLAQVAARIVAIDCSVAVERPLVSRDWTSAADHFFVRLRKDRALRSFEHERAAAKLTKLRESAASALGSLRAIEEAAASWRDGARRRIDGAEQSASDDRAATVLTRRVSANRQRAA